MSHACLRRFAQRERFWRASAVRTLPRAGLGEEEPVSRKVVKSMNEPRILYELRKVWMSLCGGDGKRQTVARAYQLTGRNVAGAWTALSEHEKEASAEALLKAIRILAAHCHGSSSDVWVIKEGDATIFVFEEEPRRQRSRRK